MVTMSIVTIPFMDKLGRRTLHFVSIKSCSSHIQSVLIGIKYRDCRQTLDAYLLFAIWMWQIQSKLIFVTIYRLASFSVTILYFSFNRFAQTE